MSSVPSDTGDGLAGELIAVIRAEIEDATDAILSAAEAALDKVAAARKGSGEALDEVERLICSMLEACAFQDLTGQRLSQLSSMVGRKGEPADSDGLLNGPAMPGAGLDQAEADRIMNELFADDGGDQAR